MHGLFENIKAANSCFFLPISLLHSRSFEIFSFFCLKHIFLWSLAHSPGEDHYTPNVVLCIYCLCFFLYMWLQTQRCPITSFPPALQTIPDFIISTFFITKTKAVPKCQDFRFEAVPSKTFGFVFFKINVASKKKIQVSMYKGMFINGSWIIHI